MSDIASGPWGFPVKQDSWKYDPNKPLWSGKDENGNPAYYKKQGDDFYKYWKTFRGQNGGGVTTRHRQKVDTDFVDPHTGKSRQQTGIASRDAMFQQYFGDYLQSIPQAPSGKDDSRQFQVRPEPKSSTNATTGIAWDDSYAANKSADNIRQMFGRNGTKPTGYDS
jgi:hypothetical protein